MRNNVHDIRDYGAKVDGSTDDSSAIDSAISAAIAESPPGAVYIPRGTTAVGSDILLDSSHNGLTIFGEGYGSHLLRKDAGGSNHSLFKVDDATTAVENLMVRDLRIDGNKSNQSGGNGWGFFTIENGNDDNNNWLFNVWSHDWNTDGITFNTGGFITHGCRAYDNDTSGIVLDADETTGNALPGVAYDSWCWGNVGVGVNASSGHAFVQGAVCWDNDTAGMKTSTDGDEIVIDGLYSAHNGGPGFYQTGEAELLNVGSIMTYENASSGMQFRQGSDVVFGTLCSIRDNQSVGQAAGGVGFFDAGTIAAGGQIIALNAASGGGVFLGDCDNVMCGSIYATGNSGNDIDVFNAGATLTCLMHIHGTGRINGTWNQATLESAAGGTDNV